MERNFNVKATPSNLNLRAGMLYETPVNNLQLFYTKAKDIKKLERLHNKIEKQREEDRKYLKPIQWTGRQITKNEKGWQLLKHLQGLRRNNGYR